MTALSDLPAVEDANLVWQKAKAAVSGGTSAAPALGSPVIADAVKALKMFMATQKNISQLRFTAISAELLLTTNDGQGVGAGTAKIYGLFLRKRVTNGTDAFVQILDDGTDDNIYGGSLTAAILASFPFLIASDEMAYINVNGLPIANGIRLASTTTAIGTTASTLAATTCDGFMISGSL